MSDTSCWTCTYQQTSGLTLLGFCRWFVEKMNQGAKPIPPEIVDKGCALYQRKQSHPLTPHYHTCRACDGYHRWECRNDRCGWSILLDCTARPNLEATKTRRPT